MEETFQMQSYFIFAVTREWKFFVIYKNFINIHVKDAYIYVTTITLELIAVPAFTYTRQCKITPTHV